MLDVDELGALRRVARELDRGLDRLRARVAEEDPSRPGGIFAASRSARSPGEHRDVHLHEVREPGVEHVVQRLDHLRVVAPDREHAPAGEQVEVALALCVEEVLAARLGIGDIEADRLEHPDDLAVQVLLVEGVLLLQTLRDQIQDFHALTPRRRAEISRPAIPRRHPEPGRPL